MSPLEAALALVLMHALPVGLYFLPWIVGSARRHTDGRIAFVNLFFGWTVIGWLWALWRALTPPDPVSSFRLIVTIERQPDR